jgi:hypothetical protein
MTLPDIAASIKEECGALQQGTDRVLTLPVSLDGDDITVLNLNLRQYRLQAFLAQSSRCLRIRKIGAETQV